MVSEPGETGFQWRLHYSIGLPALNCEEVIVTPRKEGETLKRFDVREGDLFIGDRGYAHPGGIAHVVTGKADVIIRTNLVTLPLYDAQGSRLQVLSRLRSLSAGEYGVDWPVQVKSGKHRIAGRLCAIKKGRQRRKKRVRCIQYMGKQGAASQRMQHLGQRRMHALAETGGKNDDV